MDDAWDVYARVDATGSRREALDALGEFLARAAGWPAPKRRAFVEQRCREQLDAHAPHSELQPRWRHPLLEHLILPTLTDLVESGETDALRWRGVVRLSGALSPRLDELVGGTAPVDDLRAALARNPSDLIASRWLRWSLARGLDYTMHELPAGLLATPEEVIAECDEIERLIANTALSAPAGSCPIGSSSPTVDSSSVGNRLLRVDDAVRARVG